MRKVYLLLSLVVISLVVPAQNVSLKTAKIVAENYFSMQAATTTSQGKETALLKYCQLDNLDTLLYVFNIGTNGFVIVSGDYSAIPVLAFSDEGIFDSDQMAPALTDWLEGVFTAIKNNKLQHANVVNPKWDIYKNESSGNLKIKDPKDILPLCTTKWNQAEYYNFHCPLIPTGPGGRCYAGCVATAMAQIMKYWNFPEHGTGSHSYYHPYFVSIAANFDTTYYNWTGMTNSILNSSKEAISTLIYHCGVSVDMNYMPTGSGANMGMVPPALKTYFDYRPSVHLESKSNYTWEEWREILYDELEVNHPIMYSGSGSSGGHAWVCDGVKDSLLFHFNWGWGGSGNGYFALDNINSGNGDFTNGQQVVVDFVPVNAPYCMPHRVREEPTKTISDGSGYSLYWNDTDCDWLIQPPGASQIALTFTKFKTEANKDIVTVYDGSDNNAPVLGTFSGQNLPPMLIANSGKMYITFTSDATGQDHGWEATYTSIILGIVETNISNAVKVFPVPSTDILNIELPSDIGGSARLNIFGITGQLISTTDISTSSTTFTADISTLNRGIYTLEINSGKYCIHKKFIKE